MKIQIFFITIICITVSSCAKFNLENSGLFEENYIQASKNIPLSSSNLVEEDTPLERNLTDPKNPQFSQLLTKLPPNFIILSDKSINLDLDDVYEYIILYSSRNDSKVHLLIATYDLLSDRYNFVWQSQTHAQSTGREIRVEVLDITGDYEKEIVVFGENENQLKSIDIYKMDTKNDILSYKNFFTVTADGLDIIKKNTQQFKDEFVTTSFIYQIISIDELSSGIISKNYYEWDKSTQSIIKIKSEHISPSDITQEKLAELSNVSVIDFRRFLEGAWINNKDSIIIFERDNDNIFISNTQEIYWYEWKSSFRNIAKRGGIALHINMKSKILPSIYDWMQIEIISENDAILNFNENFSENFNTEYKRIEDTTLVRMLEDIHSTNLIHKKYFNKINGKFESTNNEIYIFEYPKVRIVNQNKDIRAIYSIFNLKKNIILEIKANNQSPQFYIVDIIEEEYNLHPINIYINNFYTSSTKEKFTLKRLIE